MAAQFFSLPQLSAQPSHTQLAGTAATHLSRNRSQVPARKSNQWSVGGVRGEPGVQERGGKQASAWQAVHDQAARACCPVWAVVAAPLPPRRAARTLQKQPTPHRHPLVSQTSTQAPAHRSLIVEAIAGPASEAHGARAIDVQGRPAHQRPHQHVWVAGRAEQRGAVTGLGGIRGAGGAAVRHLRGGAGRVGRSFSDNRSGREEHANSHAGITPCWHVPYT